MACWTEPASTVDAYLEGLSAFARPVVEKLRALILGTAPDLEEAIRWNSPSYKGRLLVCGFTAYQKHVALTFWRGAELDDPRGLLAHGQGKTAMRTMKITDLKQVDDKVVRGWVKAAVKLDVSGPPVAMRQADKPAEPPMPALLASTLTLRKNAKALATYERLTTMGRREYVEWITSARQPEVLQLRVQKSLEKLLDGEGLNDRYRA
jgi:hypothetical protein